MSNTLTINSESISGASGGTLLGPSGSAYSYSIHYQTSSNTTIQLQTGGLNPRLVFKFLKSKLTKTEVNKLKQEARKLQKFVKDTKELGQQAAYEELAKMLTSVISMVELSVCGFDQYIPESTVKKFEYQVKDRVLRFDKFENFPRAVPDKIAKRIKEIKKKNLFSEYWILYLDYTGEVLKTNKDKIREKDPILFGKVANNPDKLFYLVDWVDEYCDLTLKKFVEEVKTKNPDFDMNVLPELDEEFLSSLKKEVADRDQRLKNTKPDNFRQLMQEEDKKEQPASKKRWFQFWK